MNFVDERVRVEINHHGGVCLHFDGTDRHPPFTVFHTIGGHWAIAKAVPTPDPAGLWGNGYTDRFNTLVEACWSKMFKNAVGEVTRADGGNSANL